MRRRFTGRLPTPSVPWPTGSSVPWRNPSEMRMMARELALPTGHRAIISPSGHMLQALFRDPDLTACGPGAGLPSEWKARTERALALPGDHGLFALFQVGQRLGWLYSRDRTWTETNILPALAIDSDRR